MARKIFYGLGLPHPSLTIIKVHGSSSPCWVCCHALDSMYSSIYLGSSTCLVLGNMFKFIFSPLGLIHLIQAQLSIENFFRMLYKSLNII
jgi:hypothetical protein